MKKSNQTIIDFFFFILGISYSYILQNFAGIAVPGP